ncbi:unnamed protein product, partial [Urochloa humidicola]
FFTDASFFSTPSSPPSSQPYETSSCRAQRLKPQGDSAKDGSSAHRRLRGAQQRMDAVESAPMRPRPSMAFMALLSSGKDSSIPPFQTLADVSKTEEWSSFKIPVKNFRSKRGLTLLTQDENHLTEDIIAGKKYQKRRLQLHVSFFGMCKRHCNLPGVYVYEKTGRGMDNGQREDSSKLGNTNSLLVSTYLQQMLVLAQ